MIGEKSILIKFDQVWSSLIKFDPFWTDQVWNNINIHNKGLQTQQGQQTNKKVEKLHKSYTKVMPRRQARRSTRLKNYSGVWSKSVVIHGLDYTWPTFHAHCADDKEKLELWLRSLISRNTHHQGTKFATTHELLQNMHSS